METRRLRLRNWLELARIRRKFSEDGADVPELIFQALALSSDISKKDRTLPWYEVGEAFTDLLNKNNTRIAFPILNSEEGRKQDQPPWEYEERDWYFWLHLFASNYGWDSDTVSEMDIDDAFGLLQEIRLVEQFDREWEHQLSELSYKYDKTSKTSHYHPLPRPRWMSGGEFISRGVKVKRKVGRYPKKFRPPGIIIKVDENKNTNSG